MDWQIMSISCTTTTLYRVVTSTVVFYFLGRIFLLRLWGTNGVQLRILYIALVGIQYPFVNSIPFSMVIFGSD